MAHEQEPQLSIPVSFQAEPVHTCQWQCVVCPGNNERKHLMTSSLLVGGELGGFEGASRSASFGPMKPWFTHLPESTQYLPLVRSNTMTRSGWSSTLSRLSVDI
jgi:hypothetical protein